MNNELIRAVVYGHAIGDALGVPVEFKGRGTLQADPVTGMRAYGTHHMPAGTWSDDTSMALATMDSLAHGIDYEDCMSRFARWTEHAAYTATDEVFDIGITTSQAIGRHLQGIPALECGSHGERDNGNGSLMRIYPVVLYCHAHGLGTDAMTELVHNYSALTHAHPRTLIGCGIYAFVLRSLLVGDTIPNALTAAKAFYEASEFADELAHYSRIFDDDFIDTQTYAIESGGYVVSSLEAALWCLMNGESYADCVLTAVNLGRDTDTVGAITGSLAGALFGFEDIPARWIDTLLNKEPVDEIIQRFTQSI